MSAKKIRSVFFGTPDFAVGSLLSTFHQTELCAVVTQPDKPRGRGQQVSPCEVRTEAIKLGLKTFAPKSLKKDSEELQSLLNELEQIKPDLFVVAAYGNLLPQSLLDRPKMGSINVHASLLPRWRGAAPIQRCLEAGDPKTGVCLQKMVMELDAGDVLAEKSIEIPLEWDALSLSKELSKIGADLLSTYLQSHTPESVLNGIRQDPDTITFAQKISKEEGLWSPEWSAQESFRRIRAFRAWPGVRARLEGGPEFKFITALLEDGPDSLAAGEIKVHQGEVFLGGTVRLSEAPRGLKILRLQPANRGPMDALSFFQNFLKSGQSGLRVLKTSQS